MNIKNRNILRNWFICWNKIWYQPERMHPWIKFSSQFDILWLTISAPYLGISEFHVVQGLFRKIQSWNSKSARHFFNVQKCILFDSLSGWIVRFVRFILEKTLVGIIIFVSNCIRILVSIIHVVFLLNFGWFSCSFEMKFSRYFPNGINYDSFYCWLILLIVFWVQKSTVRSLLTI